MPAINQFDYATGRGQEAPATHAETVTSSDTDDLQYASRALYVGGAGDVSVITLSGATATFLAVPAGSILPIRVTRVRSTATTATAILSLT